MRNLALLVTSLSLLWSCKVARVTNNSGTSSRDSILLTDSITIKVDEPEEPKMDTSLFKQEEVDIDVSRLLPDTVSIMAVGDIMPGTNFPNASYLPKDNGGYLWDEVKSLLSSADITFGNLEGTVLNNGGDQKKCNNPKACYLFRSPEYLTAHLKTSGFDLLSLANNHANDFGTVGRLNTQSVLDSLQINHAGSQESPYTLTKIGHLKIGFCAFAPNRGTVSIHDYDNIKKTIIYLDSLSDIVIASFHAGAEGKNHRNVTGKREFYYGEDRGNVSELARLMIDHGADVVLGHGPHVVRAVDIYKNRFIAYSLGNFLTYGRFNLKGYAGEAPIIEIKTDAQGAFISGKIHSFRQTYSSGPRIDPLLSSVKTIQGLSLKDFPESQLIISSDGTITRIP